MSRQAAVTRAQGWALGLLPWGVAPFLIAPRAGKLADRAGERPLVVAGLLLQAAGLAWIAAAAAPRWPTRSCSRR